MREVTDPAVAAALRELAREDPRLADAANAGLTALTWDRGLESITQHGLQEWVWYHLPVKVLADHATKREQATALARLLEIVGLSRYAALCSSATTRDVLAAYERSEAAGRAAYRKAMDASGVAPPDVPELAWGDVMGAVEVGAYYTCAATLELAVEAGVFCPGARGGGRRSGRPPVATCCARARTSAASAGWTASSSNGWSAGWARGAPLAGNCSPG